MLEIPLPPSLFHEPLGISLEGDHVFKYFLWRLGFCNLIQFCICKTRLCVTKFYIEGMNDRDDEQLGILQLDPIHIVGKLGPCVTKFYIKGK
jgi:hypothetical protein